MFWLLSSGFIKKAQIPFGKKIQRGRKFRDIIGWSSDSLRLSYMRSGSLCECSSTAWSPLWELTTSPVSQMSVQAQGKVNYFFSKGFFRSGGVGSLGICNREKCNCNDPPSIWEALRKLLGLGKRQSLLSYNFGDDFFLKNILRNLFLQEQRAIWENFLQDFSTILGYLKGYLNHNVLEWLWQRSLWKKHNVTRFELTLRSIPGHDYFGY